MNDLKDSIAQLDVELAEDWQRSVQSIIDEAEEIQPWYIRTMIGFGAWLASMLFVIFIASISALASEASFVFVGLAFIVGANILHFKVQNDFTIQAALAFSLSGQALLAMGVGQLSGLNDIEIVSFVLIICNVILFITFQDLIHRFLSVCIVLASFMVVMFNWEQQGMFSFVVPVTSLVFAWLVMMRSHSKFSYDTLAPLASALMAGTFGIVMLSTFYVLPELVTRVSFFPRPWVATVGLSAVVLYVQYQSLSVVSGKAKPLYQTSMYIITLILMLSSLNAPGIMFSLLVILLGVLYGHKIYSGIGIAFMSIFTMMYFYGIDTSLLTKSYTLIATGTVLLVGRWWLTKYCIVRNEQVKE